MNWKEFNSFVQEHEFISLSHEIENVEVEKVVVDENMILLMENYDGMMLMYRMPPESFCHAELSGDVLNVSILNSRGIECTFGLKVVVK